MKLTLTPSGTHAFRQSKQIVVGATKQCAGCFKRRSVAQFSGDDALCLTCRRRAPKVAA